MELRRDGLSSVTRVTWGRTGSTETSGIPTASPTGPDVATRRAGWAIIVLCRWIRSARSSPSAAPSRRTRWPDTSWSRRPASLDPNFTRCVLLVLDHGSHGALGVVIDRPGRRARRPGATPVAPGRDRSGRVVHGWPGRAQRPDRPGPAGLARRRGGRRAARQGGASWSTPSNPSAPSTCRSDPTESRDAIAAARSSRATRDGTRTSSRTRSTRARGTWWRPRPAIRSRQTPRGCGAACCAAKAARSPSCRATHPTRPSTEPGPTGPLRSAGDRPRQAVAGAHGRHLPTCPRSWRCWCGPSTTIPSPTSCSPATGRRRPRASFLLLRAAPAPVPATRARLRRGRVRRRRRLGATRPGAQPTARAGPAAADRPLPGEHPCPPGAARCSSRSTGCTRRSRTGTSRPSAPIRASRDGASVPPCCARCSHERTRRVYPRISSPRRSATSPSTPRAGFEVVEELHSSTGSPPIWRMWREPQAPDPSAPPATTG